MLQLVALSGKEVTPNFVENIHNLAFVISLVILSWIIAQVCRNILAGWVFIILGLVLKANILSLIYGAPDNRTVVIVFPCLVIIIIFGLNWVSTRLNKSWGWAIIALFGGLVGIMKFIRRSEGLAALLAVLGCLLLLKIGYKQKAIAVPILLLAYFLVTTIIPVVVAIHRDIETDTKNVT